MGDEELNFTSDEAAEWASDPRNQPQKENILPVVLVSIVIVIALFAVAWFANSSGAAPHEAAVFPVALGCFECALAIGG